MVDIYKILCYIDEYLSDENKWHMIVINDDNKFEIPNIKILKDKKAGLYFIKTNIDKNTFSLLPNERSDKSHYNLKERFEQNIYNEINYNYNIYNDKYYIVYNGENNNVRNRIQAHIKGYKNNGCLAIEKYKDLIKPNAWKISWIYIDDIIDKFKEEYPDIEDIRKSTKKNKSFRILLENGWRYRNIWPIFCEE